MSSRDLLRTDGMYLSLRDLQMDNVYTRFSKVSPFPTPALNARRFPPAGKTPNENIALQDQISSQHGNHLQDSLADWEENHNTKFDHLPYDDYADLHSLVAQFNTGKLSKYLQDLKEGLPMETVDQTDNNGYTALHVAARLNNIDAITTLLRCGASIEYKSFDGSTPLHVAIRHKSKDAVKLLINNGASARVQDNLGATPLHLACGKKDRTTVFLLLKATSSNVNTLDKFQLSPLHYGALSGDKEICDLLLAHGANVECKAKGGETPLMLAAGGNNIEVMNLLLPAVSSKNSKMNNIGYVNTKKSDGASALHVAAQMGNENACSLLMSRGANVNDLTHSLLSPLHFAAGSTSCDTLQNLISGGASLEARDNTGKTPLHIAIMANIKDNVNQLLASGSDVNSKDAKGRSPIFYAIRKESTDIVAMLIASGASLDMEDETKRNCIHYAVEVSNLDIISQVITAASYLSCVARDPLGRTAMHYAAWYNKPKVLQCLTKKCPIAAIEDTDGKTPLHIASERGNLRCLNILLFEASKETKEAGDNKGNTALHSSALYGKEDICKALLSVDVKVNIRNCDGQTALHLAAISPDSVKVLAELLEYNADIETKDNKGDTPLLTAIKYENILAVQLLLDSGASLSTLNDRGNTPLTIAIKREYEGAVLAILRHERWREAMGDSSYSRQTVMATLIESMPDAAEVILDRCVTFSNHRPDHPDLEFTYNFQFFEVDPTIAKEKKVQILTPSRMVKQKREKLLLHQATKEFLNLKWTTIGQYIYYTSFAAYVAYLIIMSYLIIIEEQQEVVNTLNRVTQANQSALALNTTNTPNSFTDNRASVQTGGKVLGGFALTFVLVMLLSEVLQMFIKRIKYFTELPNYLELVLYIFNFVYLLEFLFKIGWKSDILKNQLGIVSLCLSYFNMLLYLQRVTVIKLFIVMFLQVTGTIVRVFTIFSVAIVGFAITFTLLFPKQTTYENVPRAIVKVVIMLTGELDYEDIITSNINQLDSTTKFPLLPYAELSYVAFTVFVVVLGVGLMNLLVGLAVGDIDAIRKHAQMQVEVQNAVFAQDMHNTLPWFLITRLYRPVHKVHPNRMSFSQRILNRFTGSNDSLEAQEMMSSLRNRTDEFVSNQDKQESKRRKRERESKMQHTIQEDSQQIKMIAKKMECLE